MGVTQYIRKSAIFAIVRGQAVKTMYAVRVTLPVEFSCLPPPRVVHINVGSQILQGASDYCAGWLTYTRHTLLIPSQSVMLLLVPLPVSNDQHVLLFQSLCL